MKKVLFLVQAALALLVVNATGQTTQNWIFGQNASTKITPTGPTGSSSFGNNFTGGSASASDANGNLLFYTDGNIVYNSFGGVMSGGTGLTGYSFSYSSSPVIVPKPGSPCEYYILYIDNFQNIPGNEFNNGLSYSVVNVSTQTVTSINTIITPSGVNILEDKICATSDGQGGYWVVVHGFNFANPSNDFYSYRITPAGILNPIVSFIGAIAPNCGGATLIEKLYSLSGQLHFSLDGSLLGSTTMGCNQFELFSFNKLTGQVLSFSTNGNQSIQINENDMASTSVGSFGGAACYGISFSPDNSKLYVGTSQPYNGPDNDYIFQFDLSVLNTPTVLSSVCTVTNAPFTTGDPQYGAIQNGPDGRIYVARNNTPYLAVINAPNTKQDCQHGFITTCGYQDNFVYLNGGTCLVALPSVVSGLTSLFTINTGGKTNYCTGQSLLLGIYNLPTLSGGDNVSWQGPGISGANPTLSVPSLTLANSGTYTATITLANCGTFQASVVISVDSCPPRPNPCHSLQVNFYTNGLNPMQFTNASISTAPITYFHWSFGDGTTSNDPNPVHQYTVVQDYIVCLTVAIIDSNGCCSDSICKKVCCVPPSSFHCNYDTAAFTATPLLGTPGDITFTNTSKVNGSIPPNYSWSLGDGGTSPLSPSFNWNYASPGVYNVCLYLINPFTHIRCDSTCDSVTVTSGGLGLLDRMAFISPDFMQLSPNPSTEYVDINYKNICSPAALISIYNIYGQEEYSAPVNTDLSTLRVYIRNWASGLYTVKLLSDGEILQAKRFTKVQD